MNDNSVLPQNPTPTVPNRDIFNAQPIAQPATQVAPPVIDKQKIISDHGGGRKFSAKYILIALGVLIVILLVGVLVKELSVKTKSDKQITITWWGLSEDEEAVAPLISEYKQKNPNVNVEFTKESTQDYRERLTNALISGKGPDIFEFHNSWIPMFRNNLSLATTDFSNIFYPVIDSGLNTSKGFVGVPLSYDGIALFVNQDIFGSYGKSVPKTWDDLKLLSQQLTIRDATGNIQQAGVSLGVSSNVDYWQDILATLVLQSEGDLTNLVNSSGATSALTFYTNFSKADHVWDETLPASTTDFITGKLAMYFGKYADAYFIRKQNPNLHFSVVPLPQLPTNSSLVPSVSYASYWANGISKTSPNQAAAWDFLKFMTNASSLKELSINETKLRGYGILYPRIDMQNDLLSDPVVGAFIYQASFAKSWYLYDKTFDGPTGINTQIAKPFADAIDNANGNSSSTQALETAQTSLTQILASYGIVAAPVDKAK